MSVTDARGLGAEEFWDCGFVCDGPIHANERSGSNDSRSRLSWEMLPEDRFRAFDVYPSRLGSVGTRGRLTPGKSKDGEAAE